MSFSDIPKIESANTYLDFALGKAKKNASAKLTGDYEEKKKQSAKIFIDTTHATLQKHFNLILDSFPHTKHLTPFYIDLMKITIDVDQYKKSLAAMKWANDKVAFFHSFFQRKIFASKTVKDTLTHKKAFVGRISSILKQVKTDFVFLDDVRKTFRTYPTIKSMPTICLAGFPNVGKSTLLKKITSANPQINNYAFTTTSLNLGYLMLNRNKMQVIDTPGTLNRMTTMNLVEKQAYLALKHVASIIVYVFDTTQSCGYTIEDQKKLRKKIDAFTVPVIEYYAKADLLTQKPDGIHSTDDLLLTLQQTKF